MNFFKKAWVVIVAYVLIAAGIVVLFLNGKTETEVGAYVGLVFAAIGAIVMLIKYIAEQIKAKHSTDK